MYQAVIALCAAGANPHQGYSLLTDSYVGDEVKVLIREEYLSSRRAKRAGWPTGPKGPEGAFRPFGPVGVLRRRLLHRNGNFVPLAP